jgi:5-formyltetrahydrofolate cyclo-ligase
MTALQDRKAAMRREMAARRAEAFRAGGARAAETVRDRVLETFRDAIAPGLVAAAYWPMGDELDVRPLLDALHGMGCVCALPVTGPRGAPLAFRAWKPGDRLAPGPFGVSQPETSAEAVAPGLFLAPLLAFDDDGWRLGYGAGYYDATLAAARASAPVLAVGVAFEAQRVDAVPHEAHDERLDWVITEAAVRRCAAGASGKGAG